MTGLFAKLLQQLSDFSSEIKEDDYNNEILIVCQVCVQDFCEELEYWGLDDLHMEPCCQHTYYRAR